MNAFNITIINMICIYLQCNKKRVIDYPNLWGFVRDIYQLNGVASTVDMEHITKHYMVNLILR